MSLFSFVGLENIGGMLEFNSYTEASRLKFDRLRSFGVILKKVTLINHPEMKLMKLRFPSFPIDRYDQQFTLVCSSKFPSVYGQKENCIPPSITKLTYYRKGRILCLPLSKEKKSNRTSYS